MVTRRRLLQAAGTLGAGVALPTVLGGGLRAVARSAEPQTLTFDLIAAGIGVYLYQPFDVPAGVNRIDVVVDKGTGTLGCGLFDERGAAYQRNGFRGIYGEERNAFFVAADAASQAFIPGPINPGTWTVIIPVFRTAQGPTRVRITITLSFGPQPAAFVLGPEVGVVREGRDWYRGDLHCHTPESSDAFRSGSALTPAGWAAEARRLGLDYLAMTDHNVVSQNFHLAEDAGSDVLLMPGEEMTNWFHGHATVSGMNVGDWLDWRQRPLGVPLQPNESRIQEFIEVARATGAYVSVAHPLGAVLAWDFFGDSAADPTALTDGLEVWTGPFQPDDQSVLEKWDEMLQRGQRVVANGGSDLHGVANTQGFFAGGPTTVVFAERLAKPDIVAALKAGRSYVTRAPDGGELYLTAEGPADQATFTGGTIYGSATESVHVEVLVLRGPLLAEANNLRLILIRDGAIVSTTPITAEVQTVEADMPIGPKGGYVRAELRSEPFTAPNPIGSRLDMEAFTNPIFLVRGAKPDEVQPEFAPPPRRAADRARRRRQHLGAAAGAAAIAVAAGPESEVWELSLSEVVLRAATGTSLAGRALRLSGQITTVAADHVVLTRWVPDCCLADGRPVDVVLLLDRVPTDALEGTWASAEGTWVDGTPTEPAGPPCVAVDTFATLPAPLARMEP